MVLLVENFQLTLQEDTILSIPQFTLEAGEIKFIVGESGVGKTTFLRALLNIMPPQFTHAGKIHIHGKAGLMFQNVNDMFINSKLMKNQIEQDKWCNTLGLNKFNFNKYPYEYSCGEIQMMAMLLLLQHGVSVFLLDEPMAFLDLGNKTIFLDLITKLAKEYNFSFLIISHDLQYLSSFKSCLYIIENQKLLPYNLGNTLIPNMLWNSFSLCSNAQDKGDICVEKGHLSVLHNTLMHNIAFNVYSGNKIAIVGECGSGKTLFMKELLQKSPKHLKGSVFINSALKYRYQDQDVSNSLPENATIINLLIDVYKANNSHYNKISAYRKIIYLSKSLNINTLQLKNKVGQLSMGEKQRLNLVICLLLKCDVLILDEITSSLDEKNEAKLLEVLSNLHTLKVIPTLIFITHSYKVLEHVDYIYKIDNKQMLYYIKKK
jgi:ABC-type multidrug transport system ATPase subunit